MPKSLCKKCQGSGAPASRPAQGQPNHCPECFGAGHIVLIMGRPARPNVSMGDVQNMIQAALEAQLNALREAGLIPAKVLPPGAPKEEHAEAAAPKADKPAEDAGLGAPPADLQAVAAPDAPEGVRVTPADATKAA